MTKLSTPPGIISFKATDDDQILEFTLAWNSYDEWASYWIKEGLPIHSIKVQDKIFTIGDIIRDTGEITGFYWFKDQKRWQVIFGKNEEEDDWYYPEGLQPASLPEQKEDDGWILAENPPEIGEEVIGYRPRAEEYGDDKITILKYTGDISVDFFGVKHKFERSHNVTHWRHLPKPPLK